ncbi:MAG: VWA domain-containing protein, partial [Planctomycetota bacterium]|nr:VWA domain-containing protein [Planctomycetota bacterium]
MEQWLSQRDRSPAALYNISLVIENTMTFPICATIILPVRFFQPWWLLATVAAIVPLLLARRARRRGRHIATLSVIVQCLAVLAAGAALGRPRIGLSERAARATMILRDTSASTRGQMDILLNLPAEMPCREVHFAETIFRPGRVRRGGLEATRAGPALRLAAAQYDDIAGVVILTDGQFQDTDWPAAAAALGRTGAAVAVVPAESPPPDARIADFSACLAADGAAELKVTVRSNAMQRRTLTIARRNRQAAVLLTRTLEMPAGDAATIRIQDRPPADRAAVYEARLQEPDTFAENDAAVAVVLPARRRVALVSRRNDSLAKQLARNTSLPVEQVSPADLAGRQFRWLDYAAVVEVDSTGMLLSAQQRAGLAEYVRSGGGLVLIGAGPYETYAHRDDPLNRIAALVANPHERRPLKLAVVLDASGSMVRPARSGDGQAGRRARFDIAAEAVSALQRHLTPADALAVIAFSDCAKVVYDSGASRPDFAALRDALARIQPGGPTRVADALRLATDQSPPAGADGLVLLLSDLLTETFDPAPMAERFRLAGYSMAVVATGAGGEPTQQAA